MANSFWHEDLKVKKLANNFKVNYGGICIGT